MNITIIGSGHVGSALAEGSLRAGHQVSFGVRKPEVVKNAFTGNLKSASVSDIRSSAEGAEIIIITTPPQAVIEIAELIREQENAIWIDATNSVRSGPEGYETAFAALKGITGHAKLVKCFNSTGFENMLNPKYKDGGIDMFMAGDDKPSKEIARQLALDLGFANCYDFGGDDKVKLLEQFALSWINLAIMQGMGRGIAFKLVRRG